MGRHRLSGASFNATVHRDDEGQFARFSGAGRTLSEARGRHARPDEPDQAAPARAVGRAAVQAPRPAGRAQVPQRASTPLERARAAFPRVKRAQAPAAGTSLQRAREGGNVPDHAQPYHRGDTLPAELATTVESGTVSDEQVLSGGMIADTRLQTYADGRKVVRKTAEDVHDSDAEQVVSLMARALGLDAPEVYRNDKNTVHMTYADGDIATEHEDRSDFDFEALIHTDEGRALGLLDLLTNNGDRHSGNWLIGPEGRIVPIDHGMTFPDQVITFDRANEKIAADVSGAKRATFVKSPFVFGFMSLTGAGWKDNDLTPADVATIRARLSALRPDFEHIGRGAWHDFAMARLDVLGEHAKGTRNRLLESRLR